MKFPLLTDSVAHRMMQKLDGGGRAPTPAELKKLELLRNGDPTPIAERVAELEAKKTLAPSETLELKEMQDALAELKRAGWNSPVKGRYIDTIQTAVDYGANAYVAGVAASTAVTLGLAAVPGVVGELGFYVVDLASAGVDVVQASNAALHHDRARAGAQLNDAKDRALGLVGTAIKGVKLASKAAKVVTRGAKETAGMLGDKAAAEQFTSARKAKVKFPEVAVGGTSQARTFRGTGEDTSLRAEELIGNNAAGIGTTTAKMFESLILQRVKADATLSDASTFQETYSGALNKLHALDKLRPADGQLTQQVARDAVSRYDDAIAELKGLPVEAGSAHAQMIASLEQGRDALDALAESWKPGLESVHLSKARGPIFDWLR